jgi:TPP-dependent pyruvate/acetoin dehydrogenase alpha subunit
MDGGLCLKETAPHENPLVPNKKLRELYTAIVEMRLLEEHVAALQRKTKPSRRLDSTRGQEACRVSTAIDLNSGDLVSDSQVSAAMSLLFGARADSLLRHVAAIASGKKERTAIVAGEATGTRQLPWIDDVSDRLNMALGAALTFKTLKQAHVVVAYLQRVEIPKSLWKRVLALAAKFDLPIIFVVLPEVNRKKKAGAVNLCSKARSAGLPGIPVDAVDAVALYRLTQESLGRTRAGDGPVLIDCITAQRGERLAGESEDPVLHMKNFLIGRKVCTEVWANHVGDALRKKNAAASR